MRSNIHAIIKSRRESITYAAPEIQDVHWDALEDDVVSLIEDALYEALERWGIDQEIGSSAALYDWINEFVNERPDE